MNKYWLLLLLLLPLFWLLKPNYNSMIRRAERLMSDCTNFSTNYSVSLIIINQSGTYEFNGVAGMIVNSSGYYWFSDYLPISVKSFEVVGLMRGGLINELVNVDSSLPCFTLNSLVATNQSLIKVISCFSNSCGYPISYSIINSTGEYGFVLSYSPKRFS